jgi:hypothetical protein
VKRPLRNNFQNQQVECALDQIGFCPHGRVSMYQHTQSMKNVKVLAAWGGSPVTPV